MPCVAIVDGVKVCVFYNDHAPAHVHAYYAEHELRMTIDDGEVLSGFLPRAKLRRLQAWRLAQVGALQLRWAQGHAGQPMEPIA